MPIDPDNPPIWLSKLHVSAAQLSPSDYSATPAEGILQVCRLSNAHRMLERSMKQALGHDSAAMPLPPPYGLFKTSHRHGKST
ncbi:MAG: hypothetical protein OEY86_12445 [Nitrospira sp.]|nr:hypothetical protein [Nitrospira sp.]